ncbi:MAG: hypothetical protein ACYDAQ_00735 [Mycobacteriales bacterium]
MSLLMVVALVAVLLVGLAIGAVGRGWLLTPGDRRRLEGIANQLQTEARIDALTRSALQAMRQAARSPGKGGP